MNEGKVASLHWVAADGEPAKNVDSIEIIADWGVKGDYRSRHNSKRQVTLIAREVVDRVKTTFASDAPAGSSRRQIETVGLDLKTLVGKVLSIGDVDLEAAGICWPCVRMDQQFGEGAREALHEDAGLICRALTSGTIRLEDTIRCLDIGEDTK